MRNALVHVPKPYNEPTFAYSPGSPEKALLKKELARQWEQIIEIPIIIGGKEYRTSQVQNIVCPHDHKHVLARAYEAGENEVNLAINAALDAKKSWERMPWESRVAVFLKAASLISTKYRYILNAATILGQSKNVYQAEIDATCEMADFFRYNASYIDQIYENQPVSDIHVWNQMQYRPLEGFVYAITPFNFTCIGANLTATPAMMGNTVIWKPSTTSLLANYYTMRLFEEAGLPPGVINFVPGKGSVLSSVVLPHPDLAGIHFTGSTEVFRSLWKEVGQRLDHYKNFPRLVGETGGKDYIFMHPTGDPLAVSAALVRAGFECQGQKCSACSRAYIPQSQWDTVRKEMVRMLSQIKMGDTQDFSNFVGALIDEKSFDNTMKYIEMAKNSPDAEIVCGGKGDKSVGYFVEPTVILAKKPHFTTMEVELFAPVLTLYVYEDADLEETIHLVDRTSPYALTGAIFAKDRAVVQHLMDELTHSAGNFYVNDKPTGAMVGHQPFGGGRASGTNDKAGSYLNLLRWTSARTVKENFVPPTAFEYSFLSEA